ncbi:pre-peptidase C-terminal domain-containing protein [Funiculus sociatus GB2-A5]|uniref:Pre-peptidase C-terminal domain-containing protein n=1 Tax=Funiculus sociatus GB2-A5 TaxID=2933946 RepID=A0ABV0JJV7_9CYAN|nr:MULTISPECIES: pre-peptidase C-terminal domain-containing protein [unclassified Trichocoleus]MBD1907052.1 pre-peptidase C-terminal domain-containing protein [Trichocoleus sp. FACHB-832]MBD2063543.1 pre-peptidase C-terminal domain-containing protein [Trichocoleus sp. FACHB-6]
MPADYAGNSFNQARNINLTTSVTPYRDFVGAADPLDYYKFTLSGRSSLFLTLGRLSADANVQLFNSSNPNQAIASSTRRGSYREYIGATLDAGTYFVKVYRQSGDSYYNLRMSANPATPINTAPVIGLPTGTVSYTENGPGALIGAGATVTDTTSPNFDTGTLNVSLSPVSNASDILGIRNQGTAIGQIGVSGSTITYGGTVIGTYSGGLTSFSVNFNSNATATAAQALVQNITYQNSYDDQSNLNRTVSFTMTDGDGGTSATVSRGITIIPVNDAPVITVPGAKTVDEDTDLTITGISIGDRDAGSNPVRVTLSASQGRLTFGSTNGLTFGPAGGNGSSTMTFTGTLAAINTAFSNLTYRGNTNYFGADSINISVNDQGNTGGAALSDSKTLALTVNSVPDTYTLYNGTSTPDTQGYLAFGTQGLPPFVPAGTQTALAGGGVNLNSTSNNLVPAGYSNYREVSPATLVNPLFPTLDRNSGYTISFQVKINSEAHTSDDNNDGKQDRAGFSITTISSDGQKGIELGFWNNEIWAQDGGANVPVGSANRTLFTHSEGVLRSTTSMTKYDLRVQGNNYQLLVNGSQILTGALRDYTAFDHTRTIAGPLPYDPYETPNFLFLGDNTTSARANVDIRSIAIATA